MKRTVMFLAMLAVLAIPLMVQADETVIPPEANWTPTPPVRSTVDLVQLVQVLVANGVITDQDYAQLTQPQLSAPSRQGQSMVWTWDEIDVYDRNPVNSGSQGD
jgi:hypothetical protein